MMESKHRILFLKKHLCAKIHKGMCLFLKKYMFIDGLCIFMTTVYVWGLQELNKTRA